jgi:hypothetical protein
MASNGLPQPSGNGSQGAFPVPPPAAERARELIETANRTPLEALRTGFVSAVLNPGRNWRAGGAEIAAGTGQAGPEEQNRAIGDRTVVGRQIRAATTAATDREAQTRAQDEYSQLPEPVRSGLGNVAAEGAGRLAGGMAVSAAAAWTIGAAAGAALAMHPRTAAHAPHVRRFTQIWAGSFLSGVSFVGTAALAIRAQNQIFNAVPGSREAFNRSVDRVLEGQGGQRSDGSPPSSETPHQTRDRH